MAVQGREHGGQPAEFSAPQSNASYFDKPPEERAEEVITSLDMTRRSAVFIAQSLGNAGASHTNRMLEAAQQLVIDLQRAARLHEPPEDN